MTTHMHLLFHLAIIYLGVFIERICAIINDEAQCLCPLGLYDDGEGQCLSEVTAHPCVNTPCPEEKLCAVKDEMTVCVSA